jgi:ribonuclease III
MKSGYIENYLKNNGLLASGQMQEALTHKSANSADYDQLEFLGDSVLGLAISEYLFIEFRELDVGVMAKIKGYLVSREVLFLIGKKNNVLEHLRAGSALNKRDIKDNKKIISDIVEAIIGAVYLARGLNETKEFIYTLFRDEFKTINSRKNFGDYKSELQIRVLALHNGLPEYRVIKTEGKEHKKVFHVEAVVNGAAMGRGRGLTIKEAEQLAAKKALEKIFKEEKR